VSVLAAEGVSLTAHSDVQTVGCECGKGSRLPVVRLIASYLQQRPFRLKTAGSLQKREPTLEVVPWDDVSSNTTTAICGT
jgi:hypothetical protein